MMDPENIQETPAKVLNRIEVICGKRQSGKTTKLLNRFLSAAVEQPYTEYPDVSPCLKNVFFTHGKYPSEYVACITKKVIRDPKAMVMSIDSIDILFNHDDIIKTGIFTNGGTVCIDDIDPLQLPNLIKYVTDLNTDTKFIVAVCSDLLPLV